MIAERTLCARRERAVNTLQQLLARRISVMDAKRRLWERRVDAVWTLWGRCVHAITGKFNTLGVFRGDPTARWQVLRTLYKRCGIAVWCDRGLRCPLLMHEVEYGERYVPIIPRETIVLANQ